MKIIDCLEKDEINKIEFYILMFKDEISLIEYIIQISKSELDEETQKLCQ